LISDVIICNKIIIAAGIIVTKDISGTFRNEIRRRCSILPWGFESEMSGE